MGQESIRERIRLALPSEPRRGLYNYARDDMGENLGGNLCIFRRKNVLVNDGWIKDCMDPDDWEIYDKGAKKRWGAICTCTACGDDFIAGYHSEGSIKAIVLQQGEDGQFYDGYCDLNDGMEFGWYKTPVSSGDDIYCPLCGCGAQVIHAGKLRSGRTWQLEICTVEIVEDCAVLLFWLASRRVDADVDYGVSINPREAIALTPDKQLLRFSHVRRGTYGECYTDEWENRERATDPFLSPYYSWASVNHKTVGGFVWNNLPKLDGTSGEKTGLAEYIKKSGHCPVEYLQLWKRHPQVENLMKCGWGRLVTSAIDDSVDNGLTYGNRHMTQAVCPVDWRYAAPYKMLHMLRREARIGKSWGWKSNELKMWYDCEKSGNGVSAEEFNGYMQELGTENVRSLLYMQPRSLREAVAYLRKQVGKGYIGSLDEGAGLLLDYRKGLAEIEAELTPEVLWPRNIVEAHERGCVERKFINSKKQDAAFMEIVQHYSPLEWSDGELCIRLPRSPQELIDEGDTLRHCVGGYVNKHLKGMDTIFFVRHYRRPERSYYTLDICLTEGKPRRVQLHGYGNERHGKTKEKQHSIPKKVLDFCDRWEKEVLRPWYKRTMIERINGRGKTA